VSSSNLLGTRVVRWMMAMDEAPPVDGTV